nr:sugar transferase [uncultured Actinotalea sp.]
MTDTAAFAATITPTLWSLDMVNGRGAAVGLLALAVALASIAALRGYSRRILGNGVTEYQTVLRAAASTAVLLMAAAFTFEVDLPRRVVLVAVPAGAVLALACRYGLRKHLHRQRARGHAMMRTLVVGEPQDVSGVVSNLRRARFHGHEVVGVCVPDLDVAGPEVDVPVLGAIADIPQLVVDAHADVVVVAGSPLGPDALRRLSWALDRAGARMVVAPGLVEVTAPRLRLMPAAGLSLLEVEVGTPKPRLAAKSAMDRVLGTLLLLGAAPVIAVAALAVRLTSEGPVFYRQTRIGIDGLPFTMWKIRSMYVDADARRAALADGNEGAGVLFKLREDPRVTPVGRVLRRLSLDELPQLLNVVKGDMSLVGPRPPLEAEVEQYDDPVQRRLRVKPGLTGLWQVSGRSDLSWEESVRLDLRYVDNWSVAMDLVILWKTARAVLRGSGAY